MESEPPSGQESGSKKDCSVPADTPGPAPTDTPGPAAYGDENETLPGGRTTWGWVSKLIQTLTPSARVENMDEASRRTDLRDKRNDSRLKLVYAVVLLAGLAIQIWFVDRMFSRYMAANGNNPPVEAMQVWMGATVVEVVSLLVIVTRYLFRK